MEEVTLAVGSNLGDRLKVIRNAALFLENLSEIEPLKSSIWESEPIGGAKYPFLNCTIRIATSLTPTSLLKILKEYEISAGREKEPERWAPRILDLDIIRYGNKEIKINELEIPHSEFRNRLFVLLPMSETDPNWIDPVTDTGLPDLIDKAPKMELHKTDYTW